MRERAPAWVTFVLTLFHDEKQRRDRWGDSCALRGGLHPLSSNTTWVSPAMVGPVFGSAVLLWNAGMVQLTEP